MTTSRSSLLRRVRSVALVPALSIVLALLTGAVLMLVTSPLVTGSLSLTLPVEAYAAMLSGAFGSADGLVRTMVNATPLVLAGLAVGIGFKAGLFNIGAQGQFLIGGLASAAAGAAVADLPPLAAIPIALAAGILAGAAYGAIPGALKAFTGAHEVVTTIMLNYIAIYLVAFLVSGPLLAEGAQFARTEEVGNAALPIIIGRDGSIGMLFAAMAVPAVWWLLFRTTIGFEIRTVGANPDAARYAGMRPRRLIILTMTMAGLLAGLAGAVQILGITHFMPAGYSTTIGFDGIAIALLGHAHPVGILFSGLLFGVMRAGAGFMQIQAGVPVQMVDVLGGVILFFLAAEVIVRRLFRVKARAAGIEELTTVTRTYGGQAAP